VPAPFPRGKALFGRGTWPEVHRLTAILRAESVGGFLLLGAAVLALAWANSPWGGAYATLAGLRAGPAALHLDLSLAGWASDGLLAIFFFVAVAGVLLAFTVPVRRRALGPGPGLAEHFEHRIRPVSTGFAVPVFAFFAAGVSLRGGATSLITAGVVAGLVAGKTAGVTAATWLVQRFTRAELDEGLSWWDVLGLAMLSGVGFTVSLLIGELAFGGGSARDAQAKVGILLGSVLAALAATLVLRARNRHYRRLCAQEEADDDADDVPDIYQRPA
jgi:NhaA family Na+:H+ antiporter